VVIDQIDLGRVLAIKREYDPPIAGYPDGPLSLAVTLELVKPIIRDAHAHGPVLSFSTFNMRRIFAAN
jgi:hypothetical protein